MWASACFSTAFINVIGGQNIGTLTDLIGRIGGVIIIFFGLHFSGLLAGWLARLRSSEALIASPLTSLVVALAGGALLLWGFSGTVLIQDSELWQWAPWAPSLGLLGFGILLAWLLLGGAFADGARFWRARIDQLTNMLYADTRREFRGGAGGNGFGGSVLMGVVFSAGWTPCIGPVYGAVLTLAANGGDVGQAGTLLASYSLGLGVPFMLTALLLDGAQRLLRRLQRYLRSIQLFSGAFLILIGLLVASAERCKASAPPSPPAPTPKRPSPSKNRSSTVCSANMRNPGPTLWKRSPSQNRLAASARWQPARPPQAARQASSRRT